MSLYGLFVEVIKSGRIGEALVLNRWGTKLHAVGYVVQHIDGDSKVHGYASQTNTQQ